MSYLEKAEEDERYWRSELIRELETALPIEAMQKEDLKKLKGDKLKIVVGRLLLTYRVFFLPFPAEAASKPNIVANPIHSTLANWIKADEWLRTAKSLPK